MIPSTPGSFPQPPGSTTPSNVAQPLGTEAFFLTASGSPAVSYNGGTGWQTATLPGTASSIAAASAYQVEEEPSDLFLSGPSGLTEETTGARSGDPSGAWTSMALPDVAGDVGRPGRAVRRRPGGRDRRAGRGCCRGPSGQPGRHLVRGCVGGHAER